MSSKNIFEVLQNIAENTESNEKFLNILKENGFTGTLEEAENQINQQTQVVLNNLTTEDLQNIAGGKSLMNDKLKKAIAVGGASLMAAGTVMPSSLAANKNNEKKFADSALNYVKKNPVHTGVTTTFVLTTAALLAKSLFGGKTVSDLPFEIGEDAILYDRDKSAHKQVHGFVQQLSDASCNFEVTENAKNKIKTIKFTATKESVLKSALEDNARTAIEFTTETLLKTLLKAMDANNKYVNKNGELTTEGASVLNRLTVYIVTKINDEIDARAEQKVTEGELGIAVTNAKEEVGKAETTATEKAKAVTDAENSAKLNTGTADEQKQRKANLENAKTESATAADAYKAKKEELKKAEEALQEGIKKARTEAKKLEMPAEKFQAEDSVKLEEPQG